MIEVRDDPSCEMLVIMKDNACVFEGNYWDFPDSPNKITEFLKDLGLKVEYREYNYEQ